MLFHTPEFFLFFALVLGVYSATSERKRWIVLLAASLLFYGALLTPTVIVALALSVVVTYFAGKRIDKSETGRAKTAILWCGIILNVLILAVARYWPLLGARFRALGASPDRAGGGSIASTVATAIGVSYITFQAISYLADIALERRRHEPHFGYLAVYLGYFPKLLQGPIERSDVFISQLASPGRFDYQRVRSGLILICWGLFKKVVVADRLSVIVNEVYNSPHSYTGLSLLAAVFAYAIQIYADFSGYTDMAIGFSRLLGLSLSENFDRPYFADSLAQFWRRWHMSFMNWLYDYIFRPVQVAFRRWGVGGTVVAVMAVFLISGLWHGIGPTYLVWGALNGALIALGSIIDAVARKRGALTAIRANRAFRIARGFMTFALVCICWVFFRATTLGDAVYVLRHLCLGIGRQVSSRATLQQSLMVGMSGSGAYLTVAVVTVYLVAELGLWALRMKIDEALVTKFRRFRWPAYLLLLTGILLLWYTKTQGFLYLKF